jgi:hypothetical protein
MIRVVKSKPGHDCFVGGWRGWFHSAGISVNLQTPVFLAFRVRKPLELYNTKKRVGFSFFVLRFTSRNTDIAKKNRDGPGDRL